MPSRIRPLALAVAATAAASIQLPASGTWALDLMFVAFEAGAFRFDDDPASELCQFGLDVAGTDLTSVVSDPLDFVCDAELGECEAGEEGFDCAELETRFPVGGYAFDFNGGEDSIPPPGLSRTATQPSCFADVTSPSHGAIDVPANAEICWTVEMDCAAFLQLNLTDVTTGLKIVEEDLAVSSDCFVPTPALIGGHEYRLEVETKDDTEFVCFPPLCPTTTSGDFYAIFDAFSNGTVVQFTVPEPEASTGLLVALASMSLLARARRRASGAALRG